MSNADGYEDENHLKMAIIVLSVSLIAALTPFIVYIYFDGVSSFFKNNAVILAWICVLTSPIGIIICIRNLLKLLT